jgi:NADPH2:quinone reductase
MTTSMHAIAIAHAGDPDVLQLVQLERPRPQAGEVLIRVAAAGVNGPDLAQRRGHYDPPPGASPLPGLEVAGEIVELGTGTSPWSIGDRVMALTNGGGYAEYAAVPAGQVLAIPQGWNVTDAAALPETWFTVTQTLVMRAGLEPGMVVLAHGASGGIGGAVIQIASILGARAIGVVSSPEKAAHAMRLGASAIIDRSTDDLVAKVMALTDGKGADRVVDIVGGAMAEHNVAASARFGHIVQVSTLDGGSASVPLRTIMAKQLTLSGSTLRPQSSATKAAIAERIRNDLLPALADPAFPRQSVRSLPLADAAAAHRLMESRRHLGKIVLVTPFGAAATPS